jgi:hypothetical protein
MSISLATRGYQGGTGTASGVLVDLVTEADAYRAHTLEMTVVFSGPVDGDAVIALSSDNPSVFSVPTSVTVLDGNQTAEFDGDALALGVANIEADYNSVQKYAQITVVEVPFRFGDDLKIEVEELLELEVELG